MKHLYDELSFSVSKETTKKYSTSFSLGILALNPKIRPAIYAVYGYVRLADEIVDSFHGHNKAKMLRDLRAETIEAVEAGISINPIVHAFQQTLITYNIPFALVEKFLDSMEMDLEKIAYDSDKYQDYILGSAEVVGLMCLHVFVGGNAAQFEILKPFAMKLGSAFQKINFLRDVKDDYEILGRTYFPNVDMNDFNNQAKTMIENEIEEELKQALLGIKRLPANAKFGVYLAYVYYYALFSKIKQTPATKIINTRIRIRNSWKLSLMMRSYLQYKMQLI
ncbi:MAG TPA: phytoene/squalene synthase family protein [Flavobacterium sp.]|jgi:phytoene/squalene synthetase